jgi:hypothetical protein
VSLEVVWVLEGFSNDSVVVNFPIDSKSNALICIGEWLGSGVNPDNTQTLMSKDWGNRQSTGILVEKFFVLTCIVGHVASGPIWATVPTLLDHLQSRRLKALCVWHMVASYDTAHGGLR